MSCAALLLALQLSTPSDDFPLPGLEPVSLERIDAELFLEGPALSVSLALGVHNPSEYAQDFELLVPLGRADRVEALELRNNGVAVEGRVLDPEAARQHLTAALAAGGSTSLLEHWGEALYHAVLPVAPQASPVLTLRTTRLSAITQGLAALELPLAAFRHLPGAKALTVQGVVHSAEPLSTFYSPSHPVEVTERWIDWDDEGQAHHRARFALTPGSGAELEDWITLLRVGETRAVDVAVLSEREVGEPEGSFVAVLTGSELDLEPQPRDVVFVLDRSGSMKDGKLGQAIEALDYLLADLGPADRFNVLTYAGEVTAYAPALQGQASVPDARRWLAQTQAEGDTNIEAALVDALASFGGDPGVLPQVVFLTDGVPTQGETDPTRLAHAVRTANVHGARLVTFGVGYDVNAILLDRLAAENRGLAEYVRPDEEIATKVPGFCARMQRPLVLDLELTFEGVDVHSVSPSRAGDLYAQEQLLITGRYTTPEPQGGSPQMVVSGRRGDQPWSTRVPFPTAAADGALGGFTHRLWATRRIGELIDVIRLEGETPERVQEVLDLGLNFGVLTEYTAFLTEPETDLSAHAANLARCQEVLRSGTSQAVGTHAVTQACNTKAWARADRVQGTASWLGADGREVVAGGVRNVGNVTLFQREGGWVDSRAAGRPAQAIALGSEELYALLDAYPWVGSCVARTGACTLVVDDQVVRIGG